MNKTLTALYDSFYTPPQAADTRAEIKAIHKQLDVLVELSKNQKLAVLNTVWRMTESGTALRLRLERRNMSATCSHSMLPLIFRRKCMQR